MVSGFFLFAAVPAASLLIACAQGVVVSGSAIVLSRVDYGRPGPDFVGGFAYDCKLVMFG